MMVLVTKSISRNDKAYVEVVLDQVSSYCATNGVELHDFDSIVVMVMAVGHHSDQVCVTFSTK
jgi:hypothetical protein